jgi:PAS domain S-box-containing protein
MKKTPISEERAKELARLFDIVPDVVYEISLTGKLINLSKSFERLTGWKIKDWEGRNFLEIVHPEDKLKALVSYKDSLLGKTKTNELRIRAKDGSYLIGEFNSVQRKEKGRLAGIIGIARDITERKEIEKQLRESRDQLNIIFRAVADGITVLDENGKLIFANDAVAIAAGYNSAAEMIKNPARWVKLFEIYDEAGKPFPLEKLPSRQALRGATYSEETLLYKNRKTGDSFWTTIRARPVFDDKGNVQLVIVVMHDITHSKELEKRKDSFIALASHELKTPLTSLKLFYQILKNKMKKKEGAEIEMLEKVGIQIDRLQNLIDELLDISKISEGKLAYSMKKFNFDKFVKEKVEDISRIYDKKEINLKGRTRAFVFADRERVSQVIENLIGNAVKYSPNSKKIDVEVKKEKSKVIFSVRDYGIGISKSHKNIIFDRFQRGVLDTKFEGLGLGLYISKEIIVRHSGKIWVEEVNGKGARFCFYLPQL